MQTTTLYRPIGLKELKLIFESGYRTFPPRLYWQPIFYPVTNFEYAEQIAREWNVESNGDYCGFVTEFDVEAAYLDAFEVQNVGATYHNELWIPAEELATFNEKLVGTIRVVASRYGQLYEGDRIENGPLKGMNLQDQFAYLESVAGDAEQVRHVMAENEFAILTNLGYWKKHYTDKQETVGLLVKSWSAYQPSQAGNID